MDTNLKNEIEFLIKPASILFTILILIIFVLTFGIKQINIVREKIATASVLEQTLSDKVATLETVSNILAGDVTFLDVVLPSKGSVLYGLSQAKSQAAKYGLNLSGLKTGSSAVGADGVTKTSISFDIEGSEQSLFEFLNSFTTLLPLMHVEKVSLNKINDLVAANVSIGVYSSELPKKIPAVTEEINELSESEIKLLKELSSFNMPQFVEPPTTIITQPKPDPFN